MTRDTKTRFVSKFFFTGNTNTQTDAVQSHEIYIVSVPHRRNSKHYYIQGNSNILSEVSKCDTFNTCFGLKVPAVKFLLHTLLLLGLNSVWRNKSVTLGGRE